jgi:hypothetical protein
MDAVHSFIWDRTRAVRNDFSIQQISQLPELPIAIECFERIARFHILSLHQVGGKPTPHPENYSWQQDREQLDRTLLSLTQYYNVSRGKYQSANEAEFRAYSILFQIQNPIADLEKKMQYWPKEVSTDERVQVALKMYSAASDLAGVKGPLRPAIPVAVARQHWIRFWRLASSNRVSYLMACVAEIQFNHVRRGVLRSIWYARQITPVVLEDWTLEEVRKALYFEEVEQARNFVEHYTFVVRQKSDGTPFLDVTSVKGRQFPSPSSTSLQDQTFSNNLVENKRHDRSFSAVINGMTPKEARQAGMVVKNRTSTGKREESLFVTGYSDEEEGQASPVEKPKPPVNPFAAPTAPKVQNGFSSFGQPSSSTPKTSTVANPFASTTPAVPAGIGMFGKFYEPPSMEVDTG